MPLPDSMRPLGLVALLLLATAARPQTALPVEELATLAGRQEASGDFTAAAGTLRRLVEQQPRSGALRAELGRLLVLDRAHRSAVTELRAAIQLGGDGPAVRYYLGSALWETGDVEAARETFEGALAEFGRHRELVAQLGRLSLWSGGFADAVPLLEEALRSSPEDARLQIDLTRALHGAEDPGALAAARKAVESAPEHAEIRYLLASLLREAGDDEAASRELAAYMRLYASEQERSRRLGLAELTSGAEPVSEGGARRRDPNRSSTSEGDAATSSCRVALREVAPAIGLDFVHDRGTTAERHLPETMGAGLAWLDYDGDGWLDLYVVQSGPFPPLDGERDPDRVFRNLGDGRFEDVTEKVGSGRRGAGQGAVAADVDGDGDTDLYLTNYGDDAWLVNDGSGRLTARPEPAVDGWSSSAALADADGDGDLDLYVSRYVDYPPDHGLFCGDRQTGERRACDPSLFDGAVDRFLRNEGEGRFVDASSEVAVGAADGRGLGVLFADLDGDRAPDLYVANDLTLNFLFANDGSGRFEDHTLTSGAAVNRDGRPEAGMGIALGDVDGDLDPDLAVTNFDVETNTLYRSTGRFEFEDVAAVSGFGPPSFNRLGFGIVAADLDADADLDYYVANGHIFERPRRETVGLAQRDQLLLGDGRGGFEEARCGQLLAPTVARGASGADFDRDGDIDLAVQANGGPLALLRNDLGASHWLSVSLRTRGANRAAIGAVVTLLQDGSADRRRWIVAGDSYQSGGPPEAHFHLGAPRATAAVRVAWPAGGTTEWRAVSTDRHLVLTAPALE